MSKKLTLTSVTLACVLFVISSNLSEVLGCNEVVCAPVVSKCMLTKSCLCDLKTNGSCQRDCSTCLGYLHPECCSCVELCPATNDTDNELSAKSHVEEFADPAPELFQALTEGEDPLLRWVSHSFPVQISLITSVGLSPKEIRFDSSTKVTLTGDGLDQEEDIQANCTVSYMSQCMSWNKCKSSCRSMGASSYRWFHDGCCECVGSNCINYGINESKCLRCPLVEGAENERIPEMSIDEPVPSGLDTGMEDYVGGPAPTEDSSPRKENSVRKEDVVVKEKPSKPPASSSSETPSPNAVPKKPGSS